MMEVSRLTGERKRGGAYCERVLLGRSSVQVTLRTEPRRVGIHKQDVDGGGGCTAGRGSYVGKALRPERSDARMKHGSPKREGESGKCCR